MVPALGLAGYHVPVELQDGVILLVSSCRSTMVASLFVASCSRMSSLVVVSLFMLSCMMARLSADGSARPEKDACCLRHWGR